ncbi:MAG: hypothetical protein J6P98_02045 [Clostridia bacterium]|nr:hypothetical protein [Clostridia bacterium]
MSTLDQLFKKVCNIFKNEVKDAASDLAYKAANDKTKKVVFDSLPETVEQFKALPGADLKDPYKVAALAVVALDTYGRDREAALAMLDSLRGPRPLTQLDRTFINDRFMDGNDYVLRSYFEGTSPENDYTPSLPYTIKVMEHAPSRDNYSQGYLRLYLRSSGADSERFIDLRHKPSTDQWFVWEYEGLMPGIRIPQSKDAWA